MGCKAKALGLVVERGKASIEWYKEGKPVYYCMGYKDARTEELLEVCKECKQHVNEAFYDMQ